MKQVRLLLSNLFPLVKGKIRGMNLSKAGINLSKMEMNLSTPGKTTNGLTLSYYNLTPDIYDPYKQKYYIDNDPLSLKIGDT